MPKCSIRKFVSKIPKKPASRELFNRLIYKHLNNYTISMFRGRKFIVYALIVVFIASAFFLPFHPGNNLTGSVGAGSEISTAGSLSQLSPFSPSNSPVTSYVIFNETGLPSGTMWAVSIDGQPHATDNSTISVSLPVGSYSYKVTNSIGYFTARPAGILSLTGNGQVVTTKFLGKFAVSSYLNLENGKLVKSSSSLSTSQSVFPLFGTFDNYSQLFLVAGYSSSTIYEISPVNYTVMGQLIVPGSPLALSVNPSNGLIYAINNTAVLKYSPSGYLLGSTGLASTPTTLSYDPANGQVLVAGSNGGIFAFNGSSLAMVNDLTAISDFDTQGFAYNSVLGQMQMIDNSGSNGYVVSINGSDGITGEVKIPGTILSLVYDASNNVSIVTSISGNYPYAYIISGSNVTRVSGSANAFGLGIDMGTGMGLATNTQNSTVMLFNISSASVVYTVSTGGTPVMPLTVPGSSGMLVIDPTYDSLDLIPLEFTVRSVEFMESGISPMAQWGVTLNGYTETTVSNSIFFFEPMGNYTYDPLPVAGYNTEKNGTFTVSNAGSSVMVQYNKTFSVRFLESGLGSTMNWSLTFNGNTEAGAANSPLTFTAVNGSYTFSIKSEKGYAVTPQNGSIRVSGSNVTIGLNFSMKSYTVDFVSSGLPASSAWEISINGVQHAVIGDNYSYISTPGNYDYSIQPIPGYYPQVGSGSFSVNNENVSLTIKWQPFLYRVNFNESLLPPGTQWYVNISNGLVLHSVSSNISAYLQNGTYEYVFASANSTWKGYHGVLEVNGSSLWASANFTEVLYNVMFTETGLPTGTDWTVSAGSDVHGSTLSGLVFSLPNGTYLYSAISANTSFQPVTGVMVINGSPLSENVTFSMKVANITFRESGLPSGLQWGVYISGNGYFNTTQSNLTLTLPYGSYSYLPAEVQGFNSTNISSTFSLGSSTGNNTINVTYTPIPQVGKLYNITVMEVGLPEGLGWSVAYNGTIIPAFPDGAFNFQLANGSYNFTFMSINHNGKVMPGSITVPLQVNGTAQDLLVLFYGSYVWMVFDFPLIGSGHSDHNIHQNHDHKDHQNHDNIASEASRFRF